MLVSGWLAVQGTHLKHDANAGAWESTIHASLRHDGDIRVSRDLVVVQPVAHACHRQQVPAGNLSMLWQMSQMGVCLLVQLVSAGFSPLARPLSHLCWHRYSSLSSTCNGADNSYPGINEVVELKVELTYCGFLPPAMSEMSCGSRQEKAPSSEACTWHSRNIQQRGCHQLVVDTKF